MDILALLVATPFGLPQAGFSARESTAMLSWHFWQQREFCAFGCKGRVLFLNYQKQFSVLCLG
jgi:hypothetical protein